MRQPRHDSSWPGMIREQQMRYNNKKDLGLYQPPEESWKTLEESQDTTITELSSYKFVSMA